MVTSRNKRGYNNNLVPTTSGKVMMCTRISSKFNVETKFASKSSSDLKKKVVQCLFDAASPPSVKKKKSFIKLVHNNNCAVIIIDMAIKMGSSVKNTKEILMNDCI